MLSVDPAELDPSVLALPNVVHVQQMIEAAKGTLLGLLAGAWPEDGAEPAGSTVGESNGATPAAIGGNASGTNGVLGVKHGVGAPKEEVPKAATAGFDESPETAAQESVDAASACQEGGAPAAEEAPGADLIVSDMNAEPQVVADVLLATLEARLAKPGALVVATFKDFCGRKKRMRDEVTIALSRLKAGSGQDCGGIGCGGADDVEAGNDGDDDLHKIDGSARAGEERGSVAVPLNGNPDGTGGGGVSGGAAQDVGFGREVAPAVPEAPGQGPAMPESVWRLEAIETMKLLAGGQAEVTIVARVARGPFPV